MDSAFHDYGAILGGMGEFMALWVPILALCVGMILLPAVVGFLFEIFRAAGGSSASQRGHNRRAASEARRAGRNSRNERGASSDTPKGGS